MDRVDGEGLALLHVENWGECDALNIRWKMNGKDPLNDPRAIMIRTDNGSMFTPTTQLNAKCVDKFYILIPDFVDETLHYRRQFDKIIFTVEWIDDFSKDNYRNFDLNPILTEQRLYTKYEAIQRDR